MMDRNVERELQDDARSKARRDLRVNAWNNPKVTVWHFSAFGFKCKFKKPGLMVCFKKICNKTQEAQKIHPATFEVKDICKRALNIYKIISNFKHSIDFDTFKNNIFR